MDLDTGQDPERVQPQTGSVGGQSKGFFRSLFDLSFTSFVTARVVKFIYVLSIIFAVLYVLGTMGYASFIAYAFVAALAQSDALGIVTGVLLFIVLTPIFLLIAITYVRVLLELVIVLFRISENIAELVRQGQTASPSSSQERRADEPAEGG